MKRNPTWETWARWLGREPKLGTIYGAIVEMMAARQIWEGFNEVVGVAGEDARKFSTFHSWVNSGYLRAQGLGVRRQVEARSDVISLGRLLKGIADQPTVLSRAEFIDRFYTGDAEWGHRDFDAATSPGAKCIDPNVPKADLHRLRVDTHRVKVWVDKEVAHYDKRSGQFSEGLTFGDVHQAVDLVFETMRRYYALLLGSHIVGSVTMSPWPAVFRVPWIPDDDAWRLVMKRIHEKEASRR